MSHRIEVLDEARHVGRAVVAGNCARRRIAGSDAAGGFRNRVERPERATHQPDEVERGGQQADEQRRREYKVSGRAVDHRVGRCVVRQRGRLMQRVDEECNGAGDQHDDERARADRLPDMPAGPRRQRHGKPRSR
ncbi:hypothetical protein [Burkholderia arboris]|uniref:hypothetical protein n=1 Tax=Burkholderia arboris TaxID=488730 RepID=UPI001F464A8C|nr:hypothetical protein [Burkholderia arboris]